MAQAENVTAHLQREDGKRQHEPDPEPARHVDQFMVRRGFRRDQKRLERHAADRAGAGAYLPDLRMHRAGVDRAFRGRLGFRIRGSEDRDSARELLDELRPAARGAEIVRLPAMLGAVLGRTRIDAHSAHGIFHQVRSNPFGFLPVSVVRVMMGGGHADLLSAIGDNRLV